MSIIENLFATKATGPHSIRPFLMNFVYDHISQPNTNLVNLSFEQGSYIDVLKVLKISKSVSLMSKVIDLLSNINKIFEKLMFTRVLNFTDFT